ncbi:MAG: hypothetical protein OEV99_03970 [Nitrospira sp.]|nr:hypothetical protein [Nitrospira sp.]MDH4368978.1 hypothetical protein [Nitrospira sp.]MDH5347122.1 hypothetical protein [Nitrospira sp.]MDH5496545.1 hypothetical protein [Nitrospira sp.]MDH5725758.1 hypothetical protein [Nitrospira sp.]
MIKTEDCIQIFAAATPGEWLPTRVLEFSIRETTKRLVKVTPLYTVGRTIPLPQAIENRPRTPFSFQRFLIPELCGFTGRAIYLDADMQVFRDIGELWNWPLDGCDLQTVSEAGLGRREQFSVMLLDCAQLDWDVDEIVAALDAGKLDYAALMFHMRVAKQIGRDISPEWNSLERYDPESTALVHYTDMPTQPWTSLVNPLDCLWVSCLRRAIAAGFITGDELQREVAAGHVRPSLIAQVETGIDHGADVSRAIRNLDRKFIAPYHQLHAGHVQLWTSARNWVTATLRRLPFCIRRSGVHY